LSLFLKPPAQSEERGKVAGWDACTHADLAQGPLQLEQDRF
jgi:hypothetical protein